MIRRRSRTVPIRPEERSRYPSNWREISHRIRFERAGGRCECEGECGHDHGGRCGAEHGQPHPVTSSRVVLTTGHRNHTPEDNRDANLAAWCQRCHLAHDRDHHAATRSKTAETRREAEREKVRRTSAVMAFQHECATGRRLKR